MHAHVHACYLSRALTHAHTHTRTHARTHARTHKVDMAAIKQLFKPFTARPDNFLKLIKESLVLLTMPTRLARRLSAVLSDPQVYSRHACTHTHTCAHPNSHAQPLSFSLSHTHGHGIMVTCYTRRTCTHLSTLPNTRIHTHTCICTHTRMHTLSLRLVFSRSLCLSLCISLAHTHTHTHTHAHTHIHTRELYPKQEYLCSRESRMHELCDTWMIRVTHMNEARHTYACVMPHLRMLHVSHSNVACHAHEVGLAWDHEDALYACQGMSAPTHMSASCYAYE